MEELKEYKLGDLYDVHNGLSKGGKFFGSGYPFLSFKTVFNNYFLPPVLPDLVQSDEKEQGSYDIKRGDVFVTRTSETPEELGMSSVALKDYPFATYNGFTKRLRPKDTSIIYPEFIGYYLRSTKFRALFYGLASSMSTRASLANGDLLGMKVFLPTFATQKKIAKILKSLDDKIEVNRRINDNFVRELFFEILLIWMLTTPINDNLEQQAMAIFDKMFPAIVSGEDMIGDLITPKRGKGLLSKDAIDGNVPVVAGGLEPATYHNESNTLAPVLTISASGANAGYVNLWHIPVWSSDSSFIDAAMTANVYFWYVMLKKRQKEIFDAQTGSAQPHIYPKHIAEMPLGKFEQSDVIKFTEIVTPMFEIRGRNLKESERLVAVRDTLLPKLMSGELKIENLNV